MENMSIVIVGHVDHGKSTIIGRLLADTNSLPKGKLERVKETCRRNSKPFEYAFLIDALKDEQNQGITIDAARIFFSSEKRSYIILDAPGHIEFLKNMVTGASRAEAALLVIDAKEGIQENSRRHGYLLSMLGIKQVAILVNKMDLVNYSESIYNNIVDEYTEFLKKINIVPEIFIPISGINGDNIVTKSNAMPWYKEYSVLQQLDRFNCLKSLENKSFRMSVQGVYKFTSVGDDRRIIAGTIDSGKITEGDNIMFYPSGKKTRVKSIESFNTEKITTLYAGNHCGFTMTDQIYISRGEIAFKEDEEKPLVATRLVCNIFWLGNEPLIPKKHYLFKLGTAKVGMQVEKIVRVLDASTLINKNKGEVETHEVAECILLLHKAVPLDLAQNFNETSRFVIIDNYEIAGGGIINGSLPEDESFLGNQVLERSLKSNVTNLTWHYSSISKEEKKEKLGQQGDIFWFVGLSAAGKSTIATEIEKYLINKRKFVYRLDGDNIRYRLNKNLGFSNEDRNENIRRIAEVANLFLDANIITLVSFITPTEESRDIIKSILGDTFHLIYVKASVETCINRDPKRLYEKAIKNKISNFTGVSAPFEIPINPDMILDTEKYSLEECVEQFLNKYFREEIKFE
jgi:bifunctional enzyme CysN/CysC